jgi:YggT family protein
VLVVYALLSWFPGGYQSPLGRILARICEPYLSIFDRWNLHFGPVDFTIMAAILLLNFASRGLVILIGTFL